MAIYHLEAKMVSHGAGRSAIAAAAYMSCSAIYNDYDGVQHDYTRKRGLVWQQVFLPEYAPAEWKIVPFYGMPWRKPRKRRTADLPGVCGCAAVGVEL